MAGRRHRDSARKWRVGRLALPSHAFFEQIEAGHRIDRSHLVHHAVPKKPWGGIR